LNGFVHNVIGGEGMQNQIAEGRIIDTFAARELYVPESQKGMDSLERYPLREGRGQELNNRRPDKKRKVVL